MNKSKIYLIYKESSSINSQELFLQSLDKKKQAAFKIQALNNEAEERWEETSSKLYLFSTSTFFLNSHKGKSAVQKSGFGVMSRINHEVENNEEETPEQSFPPRASSFSLVRFNYVSAKEQEKDYFTANIFLVDFPRRCWQAIDFTSQSAAILELTSINHLPSVPRSVQGGVMRLREANKTWSSFGTCVQCFTLLFATEKLYNVFSVLSNW